MKDVQMRDESGDNFIYGNPKRFHDDYFSLLGQIEVGGEKCIHSKRPTSAIWSISIPRDTQNCIPMAAKELDRKSVV